MTVPIFVSFLKDLAPASFLLVVIYFSARKIIEVLQNHLLSVLFKYDDLQGKIFAKMLEQIVRSENTIAANTQMLTKIEHKLKL